MQYSGYESREMCYSYYCLQLDFTYSIKIDADITGANTFIA